MPKLETTLDKLNSFRQQYEAAPEHIQFAVRADTARALLKVRTPEALKGLAESIPGEATHVHFSTDQARQLLEELVPLVGNHPELTEQPAAATPGESRGGKAKSGKEPAGQKD